jgi:hypothetical protein
MVVYLTFWSVDVEVYVLCTALPGSLPLLISDEGYNFRSCRQRVRVVAAESG